MGKTNMSLRCPDFRGRKVHECGTLCNWGRKKCPVYYPDYRRSILFLKLFISLTPPTYSVASRAARPGHYLLALHIWGWVLPPLFLRHAVPREEEEGLCCLDAASRTHYRPDCRMLYCEVNMEGGGGGKDTGPYAVGGGNWTKPSLALLGGLFSLLIPYVVLSI